MVDLASQPTADVTVEISQSGSTDVTHDDADNLLTFTSATWASPQTVTVSAIHDADYDNDTATISHSATSTDTGYQGISGGDVEVTVADDEETPLTVNFGASTYTIAEGTSELVLVMLSPEADRQVTIPIERRHEDGATDNDYTGVPDSVLFNIGDMEQTFAVTAVNDTVNDDDEYIDLAFGTPPTGVTVGSPSETSIKIADDDYPDTVTVNFKESSYNVAESDDSTTPGVFENQVELTVTLSDDPDRTVQIPLIPANKDGARDADYSIVPTVLMFHDGDTEMTSTFMAEHDTDDDDDEWVEIGFGNLPSWVIRGAVIPVNIVDDDDPRVKVSFAKDSYSVAESDDFSTPAVFENQVTVTVTLSPDPERTAMQAHLRSVFDELIANRDRNLGNLLWTTDWKMWMIDHTRAFRLGRDLQRPATLLRIERSLFENLRTLTSDAAAHETLAEAVGNSLTRFEIQALLARCAAIVELFEAKIAERGELAILYTLP